MSTLFIDTTNQKLKMKRGGPVHEALTIWGLGRVDARSLTLTSREAVFRFELVTLRPPCSLTIAIAPRLALNQKLKIH